MGGINKNLGEIVSKDIIIFGNGKYAEVSCFHFQNDSRFKVKAFTVDKEYITQDSLMGLPVIPFNDIANKYPPKNYNCFIAIGWVKNKRVRKEKYIEIKNKGYNFASYVSPQATIFDTTTIGEGSFIFENSIIEPFTKIGNNVTIWSGSYLGHHSKIENHCFVAPQATICGAVNIGEGSFIGANATLRDHITIGKRNIIGAGSLILKDTKDDETYPSSATNPQ